MRRARARGFDCALRRCLPAAILAAGSCAGHARGARSIMAATSSRGVGRVELRGYDGAVAVRSGPAGRVSLRATLQSGSAWRILGVAEDQAATIELVRGAGDPALLSVELRPRPAAFEGAGLELEAPPELAVELDGGEGDVEVLRRSGDVTVDTERGSVRLEEVQGAVSVRTHDGAIAVAAGRLAPAGLFAATVNGPIDVTLPAGFDLDAEADNGTIDFARCGFPSDATRFLGPVRGGGPPATLRSANGIVTVRCAER